MEEKFNDAIPEEAYVPMAESADFSSAAAIRRHPGARIAWENYLRCLFLTGIIFLVGLMAWQPSQLKFSLIMSLTNPSRGENLAWRPEEEPLPPPPEIRRVRPPAEWRPGSATVASAAVVNSRPGARAAGQYAGTIVGTGWRRTSFNPWNWREDAANGKQRTPDLAAQPPQKPESTFRAGPGLSWGDGFAATATNGRGTGGTPGLGSIPSLAPLTPLPSMNGNGAPTSIPLLPPPSFESSARPGEGLGIPQLPPPVPTTKSQENTNGQVQASESPLPTARSNLEPMASMAPPSLPQAAAPRPTESAPPSAAPAAKAKTEEAVDWKNREITKQIPGAYLTIYPKLKFIGLCVPGQGYIRKYNQVGIPSDTAGPKMGARDNRTPYGKYYIADRHHDEDGPRLYLSWPSPDDARRIGLEPAKIAEVENAWRTQDLPPQNTVAGGGLGITGLRNWVEVTEGGFTLTEPQMEEIFTALPDKAWVFIQQ